MSHVALSLLDSTDHGPRVLPLPRCLLPFTAGWCSIVGLFSLLSLNAGGRHELSFIVALCVVRKG